ncbi:hypothetical protein F6X54_29910 [Micromonospora aurantiaca]|uniref:Uncharacterized protein n=1 Tax=Micromonospora aurantiaca (nom. illeg.) TaxID=47850 RepID=A0ABQ6U7X0_9ACTN|nr:MULTISPECIES: hypothetical protein [Micromonospora]KAB1102987.1 hypothetical protein F6X54_29910 [Micromonospora aurantiaca]
MAVVDQFGDYSIGESLTAVCRSAQIAGGRRHRSLLSFARRIMREESRRFCRVPVTVDRARHVITNR